MGRENTLIKIVRFSDGNEPEEFFLRDFRSSEAKLQRKSKLAKELSFLNGFDMNL